MPSQRIASRDLTADHIGRTVSVVWNSRDHLIPGSITGELSHIAIGSTSTTLTVEVGPLSISATISGPAELHIFDVDE